MTIVNRKKVAMVFLNKPDFDEVAFKFLILSLNKVQQCFEFEFLDIEKYPLNEPTDTLLSDFATVVDEEELSADFFIGIVTYEIGENFFWLASVGGNRSIITTKGWKRYFSPPSVFEYVIHCLVPVLAIMADKSGTIESHGPTRGCCLDYVYFKENARVDTALGYICDACRSKIRSKLGEDYLKCFEDINSMEWLGEVNKLGTIACNLKKFFRVDINKDTGFYKTRKEKIKEYLMELPEKLITLSLTTIIAAIIGFIVGVLLGKD